MYTYKVFLLMDHSWEEMLRSVWMDCQFNNFGEWIIQIRCDGMLVKWVRSKVLNNVYTGGIKF